MSKRQKLSEGRLTAFFASLLDELDEKRCDDEVVNYAISRLVTRCRKKAIYHVPELKVKAVDSFKQTNALAGNTCISLDSDLVANARHFLTVVFERFASRLDPDNIQVALDMRHLRDLWRFGPGTSNGVSGTHAAQKIQQAMTVTTRAAPVVKSLRRNNFYFHSYDTVHGSGISELAGARLTTVKKNQETDRTIGIEPSGNMVLQLAAGRYIEDVLRSIGLDIRNQQELNVQLAKRGSEDGSIATIDLKDASNLIQRALIRLTWPSVWFELLDTLRSPLVTYKGEQIELNMMSPMGNGFTFPMMTLTLVALIYAMRCRHAAQPTLYVNWSSTAVFGDDIIVPVEEYSELVDVLTSAGLTVNLDKSFSTGFFRESCGGDFYKGHFVTPFYVKSLAEDSEVNVAINQVLEWCGEHRIMLPRTLYLLRSFLDEVRLVPEWHADEAGIRTSYLPSRKYKYLRPKKTILRLSESNHFAMMLAVGGYVNSGSLYLEVNPRPLKTRYHVKSARLPRGFLDGADPLSRSSTTSAYLECYTRLIFCDKH